MLDREIQDAYKHLVEPSTSRSSRSSYPSSDSPATSTNHATTNLKADKVRKSQITYGARKSEGGSQLAGSSEGEEPVKQRKRVRSSATVPQGFDEEQEQVEDHSAGGSSFNDTRKHVGSIQPTPGHQREQYHDFATSDPSMLPPASVTPGSFSQLDKFSGGSSIPFVERTSSQPPENSRISGIPFGNHEESQSMDFEVPNAGGSALATTKSRKRAISDLASPKIILGQEVPPSSSAPAESPMKRPRIDSSNPDGLSSSARKGPHDSHDELSFPAASPPQRHSKQNKSQKGDSPSVATPGFQQDELASDDFITGLPKENYQPRPSRSRSALTTDDLLIPEDFSKRPEALARSKKKSKRRKTTAFEESNQAIEPCLDSQPPSVPKRYPEEAATEAAKNASPRTSPQPKKGRGRPKKDAVPSEEPTAFITTETLITDKENPADSPATKQTNAQSAPAKRGRKRKKSTIQEENLVTQDEKAQHVNEQDDEDLESPPKAILAESDPNIQRTESKADTTAMIQTTDPSKLSTPTLPNIPHNNDEETPLKAQDKTDTPKQQSSSPTKQDGGSKTVFRVGLSKRCRIPSLLRVVRK